MNRRGVKFTPLPLKKPRLIRVNLNYNQCPTITKLIIDCPVKNYNLQGFEKKKKSMHSFSSTSRRATGAVL